MSAPHRLVYTHGGGRLGNQLLRFAHLMAWALEHPGEVEVLNLNFWPFAEFFATWREYPACVFPMRPSGLDNLARLNGRLPAGLRRRTDWRAQRAAHALGRLWPGWQALSLDDAAGAKIDLESPEFFARMVRRRITTCSGWQIAGWNLLEKHQSEVRGFFRPALPFARRAQEFIAPLREKHDILIGLLIRHGDYRLWRDGRFFFPAAAYAEWIRQMLDLRVGRRVAVVIACDERQPPEVFAGLPCHFATGSVNAGGHWFESFAELALCDLIVSPPSTFSATAAFVGGVPLWPVIAADQMLARDQLIPDALVGAARHPVFSSAVK